MFPIAQKNLERVVLVSDDDIRRAQEMLWSTLRLVIEPGAAAPFAALLSGRVSQGAGARVGVVLSGGNTTAVNFQS
jgi:threonine dehydratase